MSTLQQSSLTVQQWAELGPLFSVSDETHDDLVNRFENGTITRRQQSNYPGLRVINTQGRKQVVYRKTLRRAKSPPQEPVVDACLICPKNYEPSLRELREQTRNGVALADNKRATLVQHLTKHSKGVDHDMALHVTVLWKKRLHNPNEAMFARLASTEVKVPNLLLLASQGQDSSSVPSVPNGCTYIAPGAHYHKHEHKHEAGSHFHAAGSIYNAAGSIVYTGTTGSSATTATAPNVLRAPVVSNDSVPLNATDSMVSTGMTGSATTTTAPIVSKVPASNSKGLLLRRLRRRIKSKQRARASRAFPTSSKVSKEDDEWSDDDSGVINDESNKSAGDTSAEDTEDFDHDNGIPFSYDEDNGNNEPADETFAEDAEESIPSDDEDDEKEPTGEKTPVEHAQLTVRTLAEDDKQAVEEVVSEPTVCTLLETDKQAVEEVAEPSVGNSNVAEPTVRTPTDVAKSKLLTEPSVGTLTDVADSKFLTEPSVGTLSDVADTNKNKKPADYQTVEKTEVAETSVGGTADIGDTKVFSEANRPFLREIVKPTIRTLKADVAGSNISAEATRPSLRQIVAGPFTCCSDKDCVASHISPSLFGFGLTCTVCKDLCHVPCYGCSIKVPNGAMCMSCVKPPGKSKKAVRFADELESFRPISYHPEAYLPYGELGCMVKKAEAESDEAQAADLGLHVPLLPRYTKEQVEQLRSTLKPDLFNKLMNKGKESPASFWSVVTSSDENFATFASYDFETSQRRAPSGRRPIPTSAPLQVQPVTKPKVTAGNRRASHAPSGRHLCLKAQPITKPKVTAGNQQASNDENKENRKKNMFWNF